MKGEFMNLKKSFAMCLSMLFTFVSLPSQAMPDKFDEFSETNPLLKNFSLRSELKKQQDEVCVICLEALDNVFTASEFFLVKVPK